MAALSIAIIGKNNEPVYMKQFDTSSSSGYNNNNGTMMMEDELFLPPSTTTTSSDDDDNPPKTVGGFTCSSKHQFVLHAALDRFEQMAGPTPSLGWRKSGASGTDGMFVGLLSVVEDMRIYGYYTTTKIMFLVIVEDDAVPEEMQQNVDIEIKSLLTKIHELYIEDLLNPFKEVGSSMITSKRFDERLEKHVKTFNQSDAII